VDRGERLTGRNATKLGQHFADAAHGGALGAEPGPGGVPDGIDLGSSGLGDGVQRGARLARLALRRQCARTDLDPVDAQQAVEKRCVSGGDDVEPASVSAGGRGVTARMAAPRPRAVAARVAGPGITPRQRRRGTRRFAGDRKQSSSVGQVLCRVCAAGTGLHKGMAHRRLQSHLQVA
jgi:hypothetical protein